jgi:hypothetical protein
MIVLMIVLMIALMIVLMIISMIILMILLVIVLVKLIAVSVHVVELNRNVVLTIFWFSNFFAGTNFFRSSV